MSTASKLRNLFSSTAAVPVSPIAGAAKPSELRSSAKFAENAALQPEQVPPESSFEPFVASIMESIRDVWLPSSSDAKSAATATQLVALAAQACKEISVSADAAIELEASVFSDKIRSSKGAFMCAEANLGKSHYGLPLIVVAISDSILSWKEYADAFPKLLATIATASRQMRGIGHFNPAVQQVATRELPLQQLAWLLQDNDCRMIFCGQGPAGSIAQHATLHIQQLLTAVSLGQERNSYLDRVLCITFGAPPSTLSHGDAIKWESSGDQSSCHFWNFLLAHDRLIQTPHLLDVMPAVMCTIPSAMDATTNWLDCVNDVLDATTSGGRNIAREMQHALQGLLTAGVMLKPENMGYTWFFFERCPPKEAGNLKRFLETRNFDTASLSRSSSFSYLDAARHLGSSLFTIEQQDPVGLLTALKLGDNLHGFFKPLTPPLPTKAWYKLSKGPEPVLTMTGCHITLDGDGVQWAHAENMRVEMVGGQYGLLTFKLDQPEPTRFAAQSDVGTTHHSGNGSQNKVFDKSGYHVTVHGQLDASEKDLTLMPPEATSKVTVYLSLETHFEKRKIVLTREAQEEDAQAMKLRLVSGVIEEQLQRAILSSTFCLESDSDELRNAGMEMVDKIDDLERWCRADPTDVGSTFLKLLQMTSAKFDWNMRTIKDIVLACSQVHGEAENGASKSFERLFDREKEQNWQVWQANTKAISAVLASPLALEWKKEALDYAINSVLIGLTVATIAIPVLLPAAPEFAAITAAVLILRSVPVFFNVAQLAWTWWGTQKANNMAYFAKLEQLVGLFAPGRKSQRDVAMLEKLIFDICNQAVDADSPFGKALRGPNPFPPPHHNRLPAALPPWGRVDLEKKKDWRLANKRRLTTSCLQVVTTHLNRICAAARLRDSLRDICFVGCVGEENAGKTSLIRILHGLEPIPDGYKPGKATLHPSVSPLPIRTLSGLTIDPDSPKLVDTPGMFDVRQRLAECAMQHVGSMAMFVVVLSGMKSGRIDANMLTRIVEIVSSGKPTLITINQMGRFLDWVEDAEDASARCAEYCRDITDHAKQHGPCGAVSVMLTDFTEHHAHYEEMERKGINSAEDVRDWIEHTARENGYWVQT